MLSKLATGEREFMMKRISFVGVGFAAMLALTGIVSAQTSTNNSPTAPVTGMKPDRTTAPTGMREEMKQKEAALRKKRAACRAEAKAQKVSLVKRPAYVKRCMTK
jgi:hypothetical protein